MTAVLTVNEELAQFIENQQGMVDPSALVNKLIHDEMDRQGFQVDKQAPSPLEDKTLEALELFLDEDTHPAE